MWKPALHNVFLLITKRDRSVKLALRSLSMVSAASNPVLSVYQILDCRLFCPYLSHHPDFDHLNPE